MVYLDFGMSTNLTKSEKETRKTAKEEESGDAHEDTENEESDQEEDSLLADSTFAGVSILSI